MSDRHPVFPFTLPILDALASASFYSLEGEKRQQDLRKSTFEPPSIGRKALHPYSGTNEFDVGVYVIYPSCSELQQSSKRVQTPSFELEASIPSPHPCR